MVDRVHLPFAGPGEGIEELSWGQGSMWITIQREGRSITLGGPMPQPPGITLDELKNRYSFMMSRHPALRTRLVFGPDGSVRQQTFSSGTIELLVLEAGDRNPAEVAQELYDEHFTRDFDYANEWPVRLAAICQDGIPKYTVGVFLHLQVDGMGLLTLVQDFANMDRQTGQPLCPAEGLGPLDQARWQQTPAAQRQSEASLQHLEKIMRSVPFERFPVRYPEAELSFPMLRFDSPALLLATRMLSRQLNVDSSPILLGLYAIALGRLRQQHQFVALLAVSNRFRPGLAKSVSAVAQVSPCLFEVGEVSLGEALTRARRASVSAYKYGYYNPAARLELVRRVTEEVGGRPDMSCFFSDRRTERSTAGPVEPSLADIAAARPATTMSWVPQISEVPAPIYLSVMDASEAIGIELTAGSQHFSPDDMQELLRSMEAIAVEAAADPTASTGIGVPVAL